jgi:hypothetical protein
MSGLHSFFSPEGDRLTPLDLLLKQGSAEQRAAFRQNVVDDPLLAIEVAETVALLEQFRQLQVDPSQRYAAKLNDVVRRAEQRMERHRPTSWWPRAILVAAAAGITVAVLGWTDPWNLRENGAGGQLASTETPAPRHDQGYPQGRPQGPERFDPADAPTLELTSGDRDFFAAAEAMRKRLAELEAPASLRAEFEAAMQPPVDPLGRWLDPQNALAVLRIDHEYRNDFTARGAAERGVGQEVRVQQLADSLATELCERLQPNDPPTNHRAADSEVDAELAVSDVALAVRACIAAGATTEARSTALSLGGSWLAQRAPQCSGAALADVLAALVELGAAKGWYHEQVVRQGERLVDGVLLADDDTWGRRLPELLSSRVPTATLADAGRTLAFLPGFGLAPERCALVRRLLLGEMRERRNRDKGPEALAGLVFGFADLLSEQEFDECERQLRRWQPARLAPDFATVHHIAWGLEPGSIGYTRLHAELRRLTVIADPTPLGARASLCMGLVEGSAAVGTGQLRQSGPGD